MTVSDSIMPAGGRLLPGHGAAGPRGRHGEEDPAMALRFLTYTRRNEGATIRRICADTGRPYATIRNRLVRAAGRGIAGRHNDAIPWMPRRLDADHLARPRRDLIAGPRSCGPGSGMWTAKLLIPHIRRRYGAEYGISGIHCLLHGMGFSSGKPRHPKSAPESGKGAFKKSRGVRETLLPEGIRRHGGRRAIAHNRAERQERPVPAGKPAATPVSLSRNRFCPYGAF